MSMARKVAKGEYQIGIYSVRKAGRKWVATATGPGTVGDGSPREFASFRAAYEGVTGEPLGKASRKAPKTAKNAKYYTYAHNVDAALENGSFVREYPDGELVHYMNGDFMGNVDAVPASMIEVPLEKALELLPSCCK